MTLGCLLKSWVAFIIQFCKTMFTMQRSLCMTQLKDAHFYAFLWLLQSFCISFATCWQTMTLYPHWPLPLEDDLFVVSVYKLVVVILVSWCQTALFKCQLWLIKDIYRFIHGSNTCCEHSVWLLVRKHWVVQKLLKHWRVVHVQSKVIYPAFCEWNICIYIYFF